MFVSQELPERPRWPARRRRTSVSHALVRLSGFVDRLGPVTSRTPLAAGVIDLSAAGPDFDHFPFAIWNRLIRRHLRRANPSAFRYAEDLAGHAPLREAVASYLRRSRAVEAGAGQIVIVSGSQQALDLCTRILVDAGDEVCVEEPGYPGARQLFAAAGARVRGIEVDGDGLAVTSIPAEARLAYVTPSHQFPLGVSLSLARRLELLAWAGPGTRS